jgi:hypothetical protein
MRCPDAADGPCSDPTLLAIEQDTHRLLRRPAPTAGRRGPRLGNPLVGRRGGAAQRPGAPSYHLHAGGVFRRQADLSLTLDPPPVGRDRAADRQAVTISGPELSV